MNVQWRFDLISIHDTGCDGGDSLVFPGIRPTRGFLISVGTSRAGTACWRACCCAWFGEEIRLLPMAAAPAARMAASCWCGIGPMLSRSPEGELGESRDAFFFSVQSRYCCSVSFTTPPM